MSELLTTTVEPEKASSIAVSAMLEVSGLTVSAAAPRENEKTILRDISFSIARGEVLGVLGESGAGKSTLALALLQLLPTGFCTRAGQIDLCGQRLSDLQPKQMQTIRGKSMSLVFQDSSALNPVLRIEDQVYEVIRAHSDENKSTCRFQARETLALVGLGENRILSAYPHQLSGGQKQRVAIAQALACKPSILIADEPTSSLDAATALEILRLFKAIKKSGKTSILLISHQPEVLAYLSDRMIVLYEGQIVEEGATRQVLRSARHPYTQALLRCQNPLVEFASLSRAFWPTIPGNQSFKHSSTGCALESCVHRTENCADASSELLAVDPSHPVRCFQTCGEEL